RQQYRPAGAIPPYTFGPIGSHVPAAVEYLEVALDLVAAFRRRQSRDRQPDSFLGSVAVQMFGRAIPTGDGAIRMGTENCVTRVFHNGSHFTGRTIRARFRQRFLPSHARSKNGNDKESQQSLQVG